MSTIKSFIQRLVITLVKQKTLFIMEKTSTQIQLERPDNEAKVSELNQNESLESRDPTGVNGIKRNLEESEAVEHNKKLKAEQVIRKRKVAILLSYCGHGYMGMQRNPGVKTIEEDLLTALLKADLIGRENFDLPQTVNFQRAARTDKGVSAARQVVSIKLVLGDDLKEKINACLPPVIRVQMIKRTTKGFNSKFWCDARTYSYTMPTFAFASSTIVANEDYRIDETTLDKVNTVLKMFLGTRNFHNFTSGKKFDDASAKRYMIEFECGRPFIEEGLEVVVITVKGQSFMLHQIRKLIGVTIAILRDLATTQVIEKAWEANKIDIPVAPGLGLVLEEVHYDKYNSRYAKDGIHESLSWDDAKDNIEEFKKQYIYLPIIRVEKESKSMFNWLSTLPLHTYDVRDRRDVETGNKSVFGLAKQLVLSQTEEENKT